MKWSKFCLFEFYKENVIIANINNGAWTRLRKDLFAFIDSANHRNLSLEQFVYEFVEEDRDYIRKNCEKLIRAGMIDNQQQKKETSIVMLEITRRCNLYCTHCCVDAGNKTDDLLLEDMIKILTELLKKKIDILTITGGEPLVRKDIFSILEFIRNEYDGKLTLSTNGTLITSDNVASIGKYVDQVDISMDGFNEETVALVRGKGVFSKIMNSISLLKRNSDVKISLSIVIGNENYYMEKDFLELCNSLNVEAVVRSFAPVGRGKRNKDNFMKPLTDESNQYFINRFQNREMGVCNCKAGEYVRYVTYNGDLYPCQSFLYPEFKMGNLLNSYQWNLTECNRCIIDSYKSYNYKLCKDCKVRFFCWPCPGELYRKEIIDGEEGIKETCEKVRELLIDKFWN